MRFNRLFPVIGTVNNGWLDWGGAAGGEGLNDGVADDVTGDVTGLGPTDVAGAEDGLGSADRAGVADLERVGAGDAVRVADRFGAMLDGTGAGVGVVAGWTSAVGAGAGRTST